MDKYLEHFSGDEVFVRQILDIKNRVEERYVPELLHFLNPHEVEVAKSLIGKNHAVLIAFDGGIEEAEMQRGLIYRAEDEVSLADFEISIIEISYPSKFVKITHRDVLGALMSLGLKRELYGDIIVEENCAYVAVEKRLADYLLQNLTMVSKGSVHTKEITTRPKRVQDYIKKQVSIPSFRLDAILSEAFNISRNIASNHIRANLVKVNYKEVVQTNYLCHNMDIISLRRHGRIKIVDLERVNRKNKHVVDIWYYK